MENKEIKDCKLNKKGFCECYLKNCIEINDCAVKILMKRNAL
jgi:hypothetical protein